MGNFHCSSTKVTYTRGCDGSEDMIQSTGRKRCRGPEPKRLVAVPFVHMSQFASTKTRSSVFFFIRPKGTWSSAKRGC